MDPWDYFQKFQAQNSESENPSQQGAGVKKQRKRPPPGERRKAIIEKVLAANSALLSETEKKVVGSIFSQSDGQSTTCIRDPFKRTNFANSAILRKDPDLREWSEIYGKSSRTYDDKDRNRKARYEEEDRNGRYRSGSKQSETMAESFSRQESNMYGVMTSPLGYDRASNSYGQKPSREMNTFGGERSQVHRETRGRSPFTSKKSQLHQADRRRRPEGIGRNDIRRETHGRSPPTSERSRFGHETRGRSPPTSERSRFGHETRGRSPPTSQRNRFGHETRGRSPPTSERSRFGHETRGRSPPTSERSRFGHETRGRSPPTSERSRFGHEIRGRSPPTNERSRSGQETRGRSFLDRNRSSDNIRDAKNVSRERGTRIDERIDFRAPRDNPYEPDRIERYQDRSRYPGEDIAASSNSEAELRYGRGVGGNYNALMDNQNLDYIRDDIDLYAGEHDVPYYRDEMEDKNRSLQMELENKTIVVPEHFPRKRFTAFTAKIFDGLVLAHIASVIPEGMLRPQIEHGVFTGGAYVITTKDPYSKGWLEDMIPKLKGHQGTSMRVADIKELSDTAIKTMMAPKAPTPAAASAPKQVIKKVSTTSVIAVLWLRQKKFTDSPDVVLSKLATQNPGLVTSHWSFMVQQGNRKKGLTMQFKINTKDVTSLQRINMRPTLDDKQLKITIRPLKFTVKVKK
ncbi:uncharacterized protein LOC114329639 isoform X5 [Diabrotica virgifera virgifera]|uniref:DUF4780 domain-containing protein n=1 Tax=Diabrotica virgifera virgifera TaxID=50390 RepID=A0ABM5JNM4_DIAVI|nr:uncharacterized protein LOC114329639 isoform X5 [Diabrotica virgifera virgifera]XP_050499538.1 uncharacterized protein LOC114329639 isoform X5 [Diabrotica virgifera virgifera]